MNTAKTRREAGFVIQNQLLPMLNLHEQVRGLFTDEGDRVEGVQNLAGTAFAQNPAEGVDRDAAGGFAAALLNAGIGADLLDVDDSSLIGKRAGGGEQRRDAGKDGLGEHIAQVGVVRDPELLAELLCTDIRLDADGELLRIELGDQALAVVHDVAVLALAAHGDHGAVIKTVENKETVLTPEIVLEADFIFAQKGSGVELGPDLVQKVCLIEAGESRLQILRADETVKLVVLALPAVRLDDTEAHQNQIRTAVGRLQRVGKRIRKQFIVCVDEGDKGGVFTDQLQSGVSCFGGTVVLRTDIAKPRIRVTKAAKNGGRAVGRAVVHHNQLQVVMGLTQNAFHRTLDVFLGIVGGHDHGDLQAVILAHRPSSSVRHDSAPVRSNSRHRDSRTSASAG